MAAILPLGAQPLALRRFDQRDGLPQSQVLCMLEDRNGFLWVGTVDGVARLGPSGFQTYTPGRASGQVAALMEDRTGAIWVATRETGVLRIRGREITHFGPEEGLTTPDAFSLLETREGQILVGTRMGLFELIHSRFQLRQLPGNWQYSPVFALAQDGEGRVWLGSRADGLATLQGTRLDPVALPSNGPGERIRAFQVDARGRLWLLQSQRLLRREGEAWVKEPLQGLPPQVRMESFSLGPKGDLVIALGPDGLFQRDPEGRASLLDRRESQIQNGIYCALRDRQGVLWIGTNGDHLHAQAFPGLRSLTRLSPGLGGPGLGSVTAILELPGRGVYLGSNTGVALWAEGTVPRQRWSQRDGLPSEDVWGLCSDGRGGVWVGSEKGLARIDAAGQVHPGPKEMMGFSTYCLLSHLGRLWVGTEEGLVELDAEGRFIAKHIPPQELSHPNINLIRPRPWGLLLGTQLGLYTFRDGQFLKAFSDAPAEVSLSAISTLHEGPQGQMWVASTRGLYHHTRDKRGWTPILGPGGEPLTGVNWIQLLPDNLLAIGCGKGVIIQAPDGRRLHLTRRLGLLSDETNQEAVALDRRGRLWFGMIGGVCILDPVREFRPFRLPPPMVLEAAWKGDNAWRPTRLDLPPGAEGLSLRLDTGIPTAPFPPLYEVWMKGLDRGWVPLDPGNASVQFGKLDAGRYTFLSRVSLDGISWVESAPLALRVRPAWYQTLWARLLFGTLGLGMAILLIRARVKSLERRNRELERRVEARTQELGLRNRALERLHHQLKRTLESRMGLINTVSHDLRSPLTSIILSVDKIHTTTEDMNPALAKTLGVLEREAHRLEALVKGLLDRNRSEAMNDSLDQRLCHPGEILQGLTDTLRLKAEARDLQSDLQLSPEVDGAWILAETTGLQQVLFNLIENALKFTEPPGTIGVRSRLEGPAWVLEVWDTGRGIAPEQLERIFKPFQQSEAGDAEKGWGLGLSICKTLVEGHGGRLEVESQPGQGSVFRMVLPLVTTSA